MAFTNYDSVFCIKIQNIYKVIVRVRTNNGIKSMFISVQQ